jgi:hypothetical protein
VIRTSIRLGLQSIQAFGQIGQGAEAGRFVFVDPTLGDLLERRGVEIVQLFPAPPKRHDQVRFNQETEMFGNALARHAKMSAELIQRLAILEMELIEEGASVWIGQGFKDIVHIIDKYATKRLHINSALAIRG